MFSGSIVAIVTPMHADHSIDWQTYRQLIEFHIDNGTNAIVSMGTTGESATLSHQEHIDCVKFSVEVANGRIPIIGGSGSNSTAEAIHLAQAVQAAGADAHLSVAPYYNKPNQRGLLAHFSAIAEACDLPMILYNVPGRTGSDIAVETAAELAKIPHIVGIKEASTLERCRELLAACPKDFAVYSGEDPINCQIISEGAAGAISVTANIVPKAMAEVCALAKTDFQAAKQLDDTLQGLHTDLFVEPNPVPVKWAMSQVDLCQEHVRLPLVTLAETNQAVVAAAMKKAGISC